VAGQGRPLDFARGGDLAEPDARATSPNRAGGREAAPESAGGFSLSQQAPTAERGTSAARIPPSGTTPPPAALHPSADGYQGAALHQTVQGTARYTLTPEKRAKAIAYSRIRYMLYFIGALVSMGIYLLLWRASVAVTFREWARRVSRHHFAQCLIFVPLFVAVVSLLEFPLQYYEGFVLEHRFDLSTQGLASWLGDWAKSLAIIAILGIIFVWVFYKVARRSPRHWWLYFWMVSVPVVLALLVVEPYVIEPLFFKFTPLEKTQPALSEHIETMLGRAGLEIPRSRIFSMNASIKTKAVDAYVSGLGASKRVVVWDTTLRKMDTDETLAVLGHEAGHYVLHHIPKEWALDEAIFLPLFFLGFVAVNGIVQWALLSPSVAALRPSADGYQGADGQAGARTRIEGVGDLASLPIILLVLTVLVSLAAPLTNGISRHYEHQADQFGLEVAYGVVPDPNAAAVRAFQVLGEEDLADPDPHPFIKFWLYDHPALDERIRFAATYRPWAEGKPMEFVLPPGP
jgi:Zn-dependent protease with chaperone function